MRHLVFVFAFATTLWIGGASASAMHCRQRLVTEGDASARVIQLCGEPSEIVQREETQSRTVQRIGRDGVVVYDTISVTVPVEYWTYDFGPQRFMRRLIFVEGILRRIDTLGYGTPGHSAP